MAGNIQTVTMKVSRCFQAEGKSDIFVRDRRSLWITADIPRGHAAIQRSDNRQNVAGLWLKCGDGGRKCRVFLAFEDSLGRATIS
jgi:hypothetical protein